MADAHLVWEGPMLPPNDHKKPCKLCGGVIKVGQQFGMLGFNYPDRRGFVCHMSCFNDEAEPVPSPDVRNASTAPKPAALNAGSTPAGGAIFDTSDWK